MSGHSAEGLFLMRIRPVTVASTMLVILCGGALGWWLGHRVAGQRAASVADLGQLELPLLEGDTDGPGRRPGEVVLLDFWASWCSPCLAQGKILEPLHEEYGDRVRFFAVNVGESAEQVDRFVGQDPFPYPVLLDERGSAAESAGIFGLPTLVILGSGGELILRSEGLTGRKVLEDALLSAIDADRISSVTD